MLILRTIRLLLAIFLSQVSTFSFGQSDADHTYRFRHFNVSNGLSNNRILCVAQDSKGFLWVGTDEGLNRFDGRDFEQFHHNPKDKAHSLSGNYVKEIYAHKQFLFIATNHGISVFDVDQNQFRNDILKDERFNFKSVELFNFIIPIGSHWYLGGEKVLIELNNDFSFCRDLVQLIDKNDRPFTRDISIPKVDESGNIYFPTCGGMLYFIPKTADMYSFSKPFVGLNLGPMYGCHTASPLLIGNDKIMFFNWSMSPLVESRIQENDSPSKASSNLVKNFSVGNTAFSIPLSHEAVWLCTDSGLIAVNPYSLQSNRIDLNSKSNNTPACHHAFRDNQGNIWVSSENGLYQWSPKLNEFKTSPIPQQSNENLDISATQFVQLNYQIWLNTSEVDNNNIYCLNETNNIARKITCLPKGGVRSLCALNNDELIVGGWKGVCRYNIKTEQCQPLDFIPKELQSGSVISMLFDSHQNIWLSYGVGNGLLRYNFITHQTTHFVCSAKLGPGQKFIPIFNSYDMTEDAFGNIWMVRAKLDGRLIMWNYKKDEFEEVVPQSASEQKMHFNGESYCITTDAKSVWYGVVREGLFCYDIEKNQMRQYTRLDGLPSNQILSLEFDDKGVLWIATTNGLSAFEPEKNIFTNFSTTHGLPSNNLNGTLFFDSLSKKMFVSSSKELIQFDPSSIIVALPVPSIYLTSLKVEGVNVGVLPREFHSGENHVDFGFTAVDMIHAAEYQYRYRLEGLENEWNSVGFIKTASYANIPSGNFSFLVSVKVGGIWSDPVKLYSFNIPSIFYKTWWFPLIVLFIICCGLFAIYQFKERRRIQMEGLRSRISRDLHDDIGSALSSIRILSGQNNMNDHAKVHSLARINRSSQQMLDNMDDIIWAINPQNDSGEQLLTRMREFASGLLEAINMEYTIQFDEKIDGIQFSINQKRNAYLIYKEALNNAAKHSGAKKILLKFEFNRINRVILLTIKDDGIGFIESTPTSRNGMINMAKRATEIGGELTINSKLDKGTEVILQFRV